MTLGRHLTPGEGRLTVGKSGTYFQITLDHLGRPAQLAEVKNDAFERLALAGEGHCLRAGCRHHIADPRAVLRSFQLRTGSIDLTAFVRAALAVELGDTALPNGSCERSRRWPGRCAQRRRGTRTRQSRDKPVGPSGSDQGAEGPSGPESHPHEGVDAAQARGGLRQGGQAADAGGGACAVGGDASDEVPRRQRRKTRRGTAGICLPRVGFGGRYRIPGPKA
ncbi:DUF6420 family protein [Streptomyces sp. NPDC018833]|uniref:DUF6420 family protein n=1 Tax=Streptomyces sp. NPDC018833 TaxID=3365053 RepID=UPI00378C68B3